MATKVKSLLVEALKLPERSRAKLSEKLLDSLGIDVNQDAIATGLTEMEKRWQAHKRGELFMIPAEEVFSSLKKKRKA